MTDSDVVHRHAPRVPDIEAICHDYAQRWFGEDWPLMDEDEKAELRIEAHRWLKCWAAVTSTPCSHNRKLGGGSLGENGSWSSYWTCQDCGYSYSESGPAVTSTNLCAGGINPGWDECQKCGATA